MNVFDFSDYRKFLKSYLADKGEAWGLKSSLAESAGCQRSFFSQVLSGRADLSLEHASGVAHFLKLDEEQTEHLLDLVSLEKSQNPRLQKILQSRIQKRKQDRENLSRKFGAPSIASSEFQQLYYSAWYWPVIHILTGIEGYQTTDALSEKLSVPLDVIKNTLSELSRMGLVQQENKKWKNIKRSLHLSKDSPMIVGHHNNWRVQASLDLQQKSLDSVHYTSLQSISKKDLPRFKRLILEMIENSRVLVAHSGKEEIVCLTCDLFLVGQ